MRKISYYILALVVAGVALTAFWVYERYLKAPPQPFLYFAVERGDIQEAIKVRSEVVAQKEFSLEFPFSGTVQAVYARDGELVGSGQRLMKLETRDLDIEAKQLKAVVAQREGDLAKLRAGATAEDISISESKLASAQVSLSEAKGGLIDKIKDAYTKSDDAIRAKTDQYFDNPRTSSPMLSSDIAAGSSVRADLNAERLALESVLVTWSDSLLSLVPTSDLALYVRAAKANTAQVSTFLNTLSPVINTLTANASISQATIDAYKTDLSTARTNISTATANLLTAEEKYKLAVANVTLYENELAAERAPARPEDIAIAEARVQEAQGQLAAVEEKIEKSTLYAPSAGKISKILYEVGEIFRPGSSAVSLITTGFKLQADVSELEIGKVRETDGNVVRVTLDAFPDREFSGTVVSVDTEEILKTEDKYYRVNIFFDPAGAPVRPGMSADATILSTKKNDVLRVPNLALYTDGKITYVKVLSPGLTKAVSDDSLQKVDITTGITDGDYTEVTSGLSEGQTVVVSAE